MDSPNPADRAETLQQIELALRAMEARYQLIVENATEGIWTIDANDRTDYINSRGAEILGYTPAEMLGRSPVEFFFPEDQPQALASLARRGSHPAPEPDRRLCRKDGSPCWVDMTSRSLFDSQGQYTGSIFMFQDVSALRRAEDMERRYLDLTNRHNAKMAEYNLEIQKYALALQKYAGDIRDRAAERQKHSDLLKQIVAERTAKLAEANAELMQGIAQREMIEEQLIEAQQEASDLIRYAPTAIYEIDIRTLRFTNVNEGMCEMSGYTREELLGMSSFDLLDEDSRRRFRERVAKTNAGEPIDETVEYCIVNKNGAAIYATLNTRLVYEDGRPIRAFVIAHDMTERKRAEESLREALQALREGEEWKAYLLRLGDVLRSLEDAGEIKTVAAHVLGEQLQADRVYYSEVEADDEHIVIPQENYTNGKAPSIAGRYGVDGYSAWVFREHRANRPVVVPDTLTAPEHSERERAGYKAHQVRAFISYPLVRAGRLEATLGVTQSTPRAWTEQEVALVRETAERTWAAVERARAEEALRESEQLYRRLVETASEGVWQVDAGAKTTFINLRMGEMLGYSPDEMLGKTTTDFMAPEDREFLWRKFEARKRGIAERYELKFQRKDGTPLWVLASAVPLYDRDRNFAGSFSMLTDITERKRAEEQAAALNRHLQERATDLAQANKELESFSYSVSHDLRTPLASIDGFSRLLQEDYGTQLPERARRYLDLIREGTQQMDTLIQGLLSLSRLSWQALKKEHVNMTLLVTQALETLSQEPRREKLTLDVRELPDAEADPVLLKQVWVNLISNALKFTRKCEQAHVEIGCGPCDGADTVYYVRDNGVGFDMSQADRLFGVFQRLHPEDEYEGTGVGLATVARIVNRHGGRVWAESEEGKGATFYFTIGG